MGSLLTSTRAPCWAIAIMLTGLIACGSTDDESTDDDGVCSISDCPARCDHLVVQSCDVRTTACQDDIFASVQCVWGETGTVPPTRVISEAEYQAYLEDPANQDPPEDPAQSAAWEWALHQLLLLDPALTIEEAAGEFMGEAVAGYYDDEVGEVVIVDRGSQVQEATSMLALGHEYVHALQDQQISLRDLYDSTTTTDQQFTAAALVEGEARLYEWLVTAFIYDISLSDLGLDGLFETDLKGGRTAVVMSDSPGLVAMFALRYPVGAMYLDEVWESGGNSAVRSLYDAAPDTGLGWILGPSTFRDHPESWSEPLACAATGPDGYEELDYDEFGAPLLFAMRGGALNGNAVVPTLAAWQESLFWRGDQVLLYRDPAVDQWALRWTIRFDASEQAADFAATAAAGLPALTVLVSDREVHLLSASDPAVQVTWADAVQQSCP